MLGHVGDGDYCGCVCIRVRGLTAKVQVFHLALIVWLEGLACHTVLERSCQDPKHLPVPSHESPVSLLSASEEAKNKEVISTVWTLMRISLHSQGEKNEGLLIIWHFICALKPEDPNALPLVWDLTSQLLSNILSKEWAQWPNYPNRL